MRAASAVKLQAKNLASLLNKWDPTQLDEEQTRQLLAVLYALEKNHLAQQERCSTLSKTLTEKMSKARDVVLTTSGNDNGPSAAPSNSMGSSLHNPLVHYKQNLSLIEKASIKHRVRSVRYQGGSSDKKGRVAKDAFGFGQTFTDTNNIRASKGQGSYKGKLVDVMSLIVPKAKAPPAVSAPFVKILQREIVFLCSFGTGWRPYFCFNAEE